MLHEKVCEAFVQPGAWRRGITGNGRGAGRPKARERRQGREGGDAREARHEENAREHASRVMLQKTYKRLSGFKTNPKTVFYSRKSFRDFCG